MTKDQLTIYGHKKNGLLRHVEGGAKVEDLLGTNVIPLSPSTASTDAPASPQPASTNGSNSSLLSNGGSSSAQVSVSSSRKHRLPAPKSLALPEKKKCPSSDSPHNLLDIEIRCLESLDSLKDYCDKNGLSLCILDNIKPQERGEYEVEDIVEMRRVKNVTYYFVKWKNWPSEFNTWEPLTNIGNCKMILYHFMQRPLTKYHLNHPQDSSSLVNILFSMTKPDFSDPLSLLMVLGKPVDTQKNHPYKLNPLKKVLCEILATRCVLENKLKVAEKFGNVDELICFVTKRQQVIKELELWKESRIKNFNMDVENLVDMEIPPLDFEFIQDYRAGEGIEIPNDPLVGCECTDCFNSKSQCCPSKSGAHFAFTKTGVLHITPGFPIYECNNRCLCGPDCNNRITQNGTKVRLSIFRTSSGKGWGVKTLDKIRKDTFVMEYLGEIISSEEAEQRGKSYDQQGSTYLFDLDFEGENNAFTVDATHVGNASHFVNHSCSPNMTVFAVWVNNLDSRMPRIAFFSNRTILPGEELTFDYTMNMQRQNKRQNDQSMDDLEVSFKNKMLCKCGASHCRKFIFT